ncbi:MAG: DUF2782 domain-containing protein [Betaproteobacteria bacterium]|nr:MAG: DUF2782 domain-containing protein [Betaproteobacteria bacterium]
MRATPVGLVFALALAIATNAFAQKTPDPPTLEPVPEAPPPPPEVANDPELEPQVTIVRRERETIEEYRVSGRLVMIKVIPKSGRPYYLVAEGPNGTFVRRDSLDTGLRVPMWLLFSF